MRVCFLTTSIIALAAGSFARGDVLPRYKLALGQELTYVSSSTFKYERGVLTSGSTGVYDVVAKNADGGWHIIGRVSDWETQGSAPPASPDVDLIAFDLHPDGSAALSPGVESRSGIPADFPALAADESQWKGSWERGQPYGGRITYKALPSTRPGLIEFSGTRTDPIDKIYAMTNESTYQFDPARGLLVSTISRDSQGYGFVGKGEGSDKLVTDGDKPRAWLEQFSHDCQVYFDANKKASDIEAKAGDDPAKIDGVFAQAKDVLAAAQKQVASPEVADLFSKQIAGMDSDLQYMKEQAQDRQAVLNKPAPTWLLADLTGANHSLDEYRGKVVVLDFWYRGCGWCMRAMPEMKQLAADFAGKPVAVLGMNTDSDPADPKFVVNAFGLTYPILHTSQDLVQQYHVRGFPTVVVIGPDGTVQDIKVGYSPDLRDQLAAKITTLVQAR